MSRETVEKIVEKAVEEIIVGTDLELVDVEFVKERDWYLRIYLDKPGGIEIDDCQKVSEQLDAKLDALDPIKEHYYLEVSSPGLDRPLKKEKDFIHHMGDIIEIHTFMPINDQKEFVGTLVGLKDNEVLIDIDGKELSIPRDKTSVVRLHIDF